MVVGADAPFLEGHGHGLELDGHVAHPDAEFQASARKDVERCEFLGEHDRRALGKDHDAGPQSQGRGVGGEEGQGGDLVHEVGVGPDRGRRRAGAGGDEVLARPDRLEAGLFGGYGHPDHIQVHRVGTRWAEQAAIGRVRWVTLNRDSIRRSIEEALATGDLDGMAAATLEERRERAGQEAFGTPPTTSPTLST